MTSTPRSRPVRTTGATYTVAFLLLCLAATQGATAAPGRDPEVPRATAALALAGAAAPAVSAPMPASSLDVAFQRRAGWIGGDAAYSVPVGENRRLWLFGDSLVGSVEHGRRRILAMPRNAIAIQNGKDLAKASLRFVFGHDAHGRVQAYFDPPDGRGWLWPLHGIRLSQGLVLFFTQMEAGGTPDPFDFHPIGSWLFLVGNPDEEPEAWKIHSFRIPFGRYDRDDQRIFGASVLRDGPFVYVYGTFEHRRPSACDRRLLVARVSPDAIADFGAWRFRAGPLWSKSVADAAGIAPDVATELSVTADPAGAGYILVTSASALSPRIVCRHSARPEGPWGPPLALHTCVEPGDRGGVFCYAAKAHDGLAQIPGELVISYVCNAMTLGAVADDPSIYRPRFLRLPPALR